MGLIDELSDAVRHFRFGKLDLLDRIGEIGFHPTKGGVLITNWYDYSPENQHGDCGELAVKAYAELKKKFPGMTFGVYWGNDPYLFNQAVGCHAVLIAVGDGYVEKNSLLVDPSLKVVAPLLESGYSLDRAEPETIVRTKINNRKIPLELVGETSTFLGQSELNGILFYLELNNGRVWPNVPDSSEQLNLTTFCFPSKDDTILFPGGMPLFMKNTLPISPAPMEIRKQAPYLELAYLLEIKARECAGVKPDIV